MKAYANHNNLRQPNEGDAGYDIHLTRPLLLLPKQRKLIDTGVHLQLPDGVVGMITGRSSSAKRGIAVLGGIIDPGYRGSIGVVVYNTSWRPRYFRYGERIAQILLLRNVVPGIEWVPDPAYLGETDRGEKGFGERTGR